CSDESGVAGHSHVVFHASGGPAIFIFNAKTKPDRHAGFYGRRVAFPHHAVVVAELANGGGWSQVRVAGIIARESASEERRQINFAHLGFRKSGVVHDVSKNLVVAGGNRGQLDGKMPFAGLVRMQMPELFMSGV